MADPFYSQDDEYGQDNYDDQQDDQFTDYEDDYDYDYDEEEGGMSRRTLIIIAVVVVVMIGRERRWFEKQYTYTTKFNSGENISVGTQVRIRGIQTGEVKSVYLTDDNLIEVKFQVFQEYAERIRKDSVMKKRAPLIGTKYLEIIPGEANMPVLAGGSYVWSEDTVEGKRILSTSSSPSPSLPRSIAPPSSPKSTWNWSWRPRTPPTSPPCTSTTSPCSTRSPLIAPIPGRNSRIWMRN